MWDDIPYVYYYHSANEINIKPDDAGQKKNSSRVS